MSQDSTQNVHSITSSHSSSENAANAEQHVKKSEPATVKAVKAAPKPVAKHTVKKEPAAASRPSENKSSKEQNNMDCLFSCNAALTQTAESIHAQLTQQGHALFSENIKLSKDFFKCKTVSDVLEWQSRIFRLHSTACLENTVKLTESLLNCNNKTIEPIMQGFSRTIEQVSSSLKKK